MWNDNGQLCIISSQMCFSNFFLESGVYHSEALGYLWSSWLSENTSELWALGELGYDTLSSVIPGLAPSMSTVLGLKVKIISCRTGDCRTLPSTFLSAGCQSKLSIRVRRCVTKQVRRAVPPPTPWVFSWVLVPKGCRQWAVRSSLCYRASLGKMN